MLLTKSVTYVEHHEVMKCISESDRRQ